jgi:hypothetical protein
MGILDTILRDRLRNLAGGPLSYERRLLSVWNQTRVDAVQVFVCFLALHNSR